MASCLQGQAPCSCGPPIPSVIPDRNWSERKENDTGQEIFQKISLVQNSRRIYTKNLTIRQQTQTNEKKANYLNRHLIKEDIRMRDMNEKGVLWFK